MIYEVHPNQKPVKTQPPAKKRLANPIADAIDPSDLGAADLDFIMQAARAFPNLRAFESDLPGASSRCIFLATQKPTARQIQAFIKRQ